MQSGNSREALGSDAVHRDAQNLSAAWSKHQGKTAKDKGRNDSKACWALCWLLYTPHPLSLQQHSAAGFPVSIPPKKKLELQDNKKIAGVLQLIKMQRKDLTQVSVTEKPPVPTVIQFARWPIMGRA